MDISKILFVEVSPLALKTILYFVVFKWRSLRATFMNCVIIGSAAYLIQVVPIPFPPSARLVLVIGAAIILTMKFTEVDFYPDGFLIPLGVEIAASILHDYVLIPLGTFIR